VAAASGKRRYVALLRGINLGARNRVSMSRLREICETVGGEDVKTYIASGNVVLTSADSAAELARRLGRSIEKEFGIDIVVVVMTASELATLVRKNPFPSAKLGTLHVAFAANAIDKSAAARLAKLDFPPQKLLVCGRQIYFHLPNGYGRAHLPMEIDRIVGKKTTVRNWRTVVTLSDMASGAAA
jgi:uncharacterized protein (DUF1697 family)